MSDMLEISQALDELTETFNKAKREIEIISRHSYKLNEKLATYEISMKLYEALIIINDVQGRVSNFKTGLIEE